jgi:hypothetical protein
MRGRLARRAATAIVATLIVSATLSGCGAEQQPAAAPQPSRAWFVQHARAVSVRWDRSATGRIWRTGLVLTGTYETTEGQLVQLPANAGFTSQRQKDAFSSGYFRLGAAIPGRSPRDVIRLAGGSTLKLPVQDARAAFAELATHRPCGGPYPCSSLRDLTVISMRATVVTLPTNLGMAEIPAWQFRMAGLSWPFTEVAVAPSAVTVLPMAFGMQVSRLLAVSDGGRELTLGAIIGACSGQPKPRLSALVYQTATTVVVGFQWMPTGAPSSPTCVGIGLLVILHAALNRPLGRRVVLDVLSGRPLSA